VRSRYADEMAADGSQNCAGGDGIKSSIRWFSVDLPGIPLCLPRWQLRTSP